MPRTEGHTLPREVTGALDQLSLRDPRAREAALAELMRGVPALDRPRRQLLGDALVDLLGSPDPHARSFACVPLAYLASEMVWRRAWTEPFLRWWAEEPDQRGYDAAVGWIHAVAHGADVIGELGRTSAVPAADLLATIARRLTHPAATVWRDQEEDRIALAAAQVLLQDDLSEKAATRWIKDLRPRVADTGPPIPASTVNICRTLRSLYVVVDGPVPAGRRRSVKHAGKVQQQIRALLETAEPWLAAP